MEDLLYLAKPFIFKHLRQILKKTPYLKGCRGWEQLPERHLYGELGLVRLIALIPSIRLRL